MLYRNTLLAGSAMMPGMVDAGYGPRKPWMPVFAAETGEGGGTQDDDTQDETGDEGGSDANEGGTTKTKSNSRARTQTGPSEEEKRLERDLARRAKALADAQTTIQDLQKQLKSFDGIDPAAVRELLASQAKAEEDKLKASGDFEALKARMVGEHKKEIDTERARVQEMEASIKGFQKQIHELTIGSAFDNSSFLRDQTVLTPSKARRVYEDHFEVKDGRVVAFDRPVGEKDRQPIVDARGNPLAFDEAIKQIVEADPDRDRLLKSSVRQGSGHSPSGGTTTNNQGSQDNKSKTVYGVSAIAAALAARRK